MFDPIAKVAVGRQHEMLESLAYDASENKLARLFASLREVTSASNSRTFKLLESSKRKVAQKVIEEAGEVALEAVRRRRHGVVRERAPTSSITSSSCGAGRALSPAKSGQKCADARPRTGSPKNFRNQRSAITSRLRRMGEPAR